MSHLKGLAYIGCHGLTKASIDSPGDDLYLPWFAMDLFETPGTFTESFTESFRAHMAFFMLPKA